jgi:hypothetical protein
VNYIHGLGGPMITVVIIGAALLSIFGKIQWPALFALGVFTATFFGAPAIVRAIVPGTVQACDNSSNSYSTSNHQDEPFFGDSFLDGEPW